MDAWSTVTTVPVAVTPGRTGHLLADEGRGIERGRGEPRVAVSGKAVLPVGRPAGVRGRGGQRVSSRAEGRQRRATSFWVTMGVDFLDPALVGRAIHDRGAPCRTRRDDRDRVCGATLPDRPGVAAVTRRPRTPQ